MAEVERLAATGTPVLGICNGFQILCEAGILQGALVANQDLKFICKPVTLRVESTDSVLTASATVGQVLRIPLNSYEGNYVTQIQRSPDNDATVVLRYCDDNGDLTPDANPNGSMHAVAGITNDRGNVAGLMPHPERAIEDILGSSDGRVLLESFAASIASVNA
jgi:phosphoribosylformylglycinamidine synthase